MILLRSLELIQINHMKHLGFSFAAHTNGPWNIGRQVRRQKRTVQQRGMVYHTQQTDGRLNEMSGIEKPEI
jgi:hypothetical protein